MEPDPKRIIGWVLILVVPVVAVIFLSGLLTFLPTGTMQLIVREQFAAVVGLPMAALLAAFIDIALRQAEGPVKFEGLGFRFEGASGQVILWAICFLSIAGGIKLLWNPG